MTMGKLSGKTRVEGVDTAGLVVEAHERDDAGHNTTVYRTKSDSSGNWVIPRLDTNRVYDVVMRTPDKMAVISDSRRPVLDDNPRDPFFKHIALQTSFDNLFADDFGSPIVKYGDPTIVNDPVRGNVLNIPAGSGHAIKFDVANDGKLDVSVGDFTIEMWIKITATTSAYGYPFSLGGGLNYSWHAATFGLGPTGYTGNWALRSRAAEQTNAAPDINNYRTFSDPTSSAPFSGRWVHAAITRREDKFRMFLNGRVVDTVTSAYTSTAWYPLMRYANKSGISVGAPFWSDTGIPAEGLACMIDDLRITRACRYSSDFTPPTSIYNPTRIYGKMDSDRILPTTSVSNSGLTTTMYNSNFLYGNMPKKSGKWYCEYRCTADSQNTRIGVATVNSGPTWNDSVNRGEQMAIYVSNRPSFVSAKTVREGGDSNGVTYGALYTTGDVIGIALDLDDGTLIFYKNGVSQGFVPNPGIAQRGVSGIIPVAYANTSSTAGGTWNFGATAFAYPVPDGYNPGWYEE